MGRLLKNRHLAPGEEGVLIPAGATSTRPSAPVFGLIRFNTDNNSVEYFNVTQFNTLSNADSLSYTVDTFTGDGSTTVFTMTVAEATTSQFMVFVGSIYQDSTSAYTVDGGFDITFTSAPPAGLPISIIHSQT